VSALEPREDLGNDLVPQGPSDGQIYAGEIPWSHRFFESGKLDPGIAPYAGRVGEYVDGLEVDVEFLSHQYHPDAETAINQARGAYVPSALVAGATGLRQRPGRLDLIELNGREASKSFVAPNGFSGHLLYIREDVLAEYAQTRPLIQLAWGERRVKFDWPHDAPDWLQETPRHADLWRRVELRRLS
jgi:hypothetical protein